MSAAELYAGGLCPTCQHHHAGDALGRICVGCPCPERPTGPVATPPQLVMPPRDGRELERAVRDLLADHPATRHLIARVRADLAEHIARGLEDRVTWDRLLADPLGYLARWDYD